MLQMAAVNSLLENVNRALCVLPIHSLIYANVS